MCRTGSVPFFGDWRGALLSDVRGFVLEVGAGSGPNLDRYPAGVSLVATEFNEESIVQAKRSMAKPKASARIRLASADIEHLAFPDNTFDAAVATLVFCSVERPVDGLREVMRVLKPGSKFYMIDHVRSHHARLARLQDKLNSRWYRWAEGCNLNRDTEANVRAAGFALEYLSVRYLGLIKTMVALKPN